MDIIEEHDGVAGGGTLFDGDGEGIGEEFDEGSEVGAEDFAGEGVIEMGTRLKAGDAEVDEIPGIGFGGIYGGEQRHGGVHLLPPLVGGGVGELGGQLEKFVVVPGGHRISLRTFVTGRGAGGGEIQHAEFGIQREIDGEKGLTGETLIVV